MRAPQPVSRLAVALDLPAERVPVGTLAWAEDKRLSAFQYDPAFLARGLALSPFRLPAGQGVHWAPPAPFEGLHGVFADSLPDGWGRLLVDRHMAALGHSPAKLSPLDRLALVGTRGMGALCYLPERTLAGPVQPADLDWFARQAWAIEGGQSGSVEALLRANGGSAGARPKILVLRHSETGAIRPDYGQKPAPREEAWLVKLPSRLDPKDAGRVEYAYALMAAAAGIVVPPVLLLPGTAGQAYFAVRRFDRFPRAHVHTLAGLVHADFRAPSLDYDDLLKVTSALTRDVGQVQETFRRMVFNVLVGNRDDHAKNHAFTMADDGRWSLTPAYDLTLSGGPSGQHNLTVAGEGRAPGPAQFAQVAQRASLGRAMAIRMTELVRAGLATWPQAAAAAGLSRRRTGMIGTMLKRGSENGERS